MEERFIREAYMNKPIPDELPTQYKPEYIMLRFLYEQFRRKETSLEFATYMKDNIVKLGEISKKETLATIRYFVLQYMEIVKVDRDDESIECLDALLVRYFKEASF